MKAIKSYVIFMSGWFGMLGVQKFEDDSAKMLSMFAAIVVYAFCVIFWKE